MNKWKDEFDQVFYEPYFSVLSAREKIPIRVFHNFSDLQKRLKRTAVMQVSQSLDSASFASPPNYVDRWMASARSCKLQ